MRRSIWLALSLAIAAPLAAAGDLADSRQQELQNLIGQDCGACHGLTRRGGLGPALLPETLHGRSADYLAGVILDGRPGTAMPPWRPLLTPAEARWIAEQLLEGVPE